MGFGLLFIGYIFTFGLTSGTNYILSLFGIVGAAILYMASNKLSIYTVNFKNAKYTALALGGVYVLNAVVQLLQKHFIPDMNSLIIGVVGGVVVAVTFLYNFFMYNGIADIAKTAENYKIAATAVYDNLIMIVYYAAIIIARVIYPYSQKASAVFSFSSMILGFVWLIASVVLLFTCYMRICSEGEEGMDDKKGN